MRTICVTGNGLLKLKPDTTRITVWLEGSFPEYAEAVRRSSEDTGIVRELFSGFGFERSDLKTLSFNVETEYESVEENGRYVQRFSGYRYSHVLKVDFASDNDLLGRLLYALARCAVRPEFRVSYTVKDPEKAKNDLLAAAFSDAETKASVLAQAAGVTLKEILQIDYSRKQIDFEVRPMNRKMMAAECADMSVPCGASYDMDIEPDDVEVSDTVTVLWEIG